MVTIFLEFTKKPIKILAFGVFEVSVENFVAVCKSAYSLYAVYEKAKF